MPENINFEKRSAGIFVDSAFINNLMPRANGEYVKVYLFALAKATEARSCTYTEISQVTGLLESDVKRAFEYWAEVGAIKMENGTVTFAQISYPDSSSSPAAGAADAADTSKRRNMEEVTGAVSASKVLSDMCMMAQDMLGKTLTSQDMSTLYWFYDALSFSPELILMLLEYCVSKEKRSMKYIERVAVAWHESGVKTLEQAEEYVRKEEEKTDYFGAVRRLMRINDRPFSQSEEAYLTKWRDTCKMSEEMVALAYEYCVLQISKVSFPYMDKIITRWDSRNIRTVAQAEQDNENFKRGASVQQNHPDNLRSHSNHDELERIMREKLNNKGDF